MDLTQVTLNLPPALVADLRLMAADRDETPGDMIRTLLLREVARQPDPRLRDSVTETLVARLRRFLAPDMDAALSWADIVVRLGRRGYVLRPAGSELGLHNTRGDFLCKTSALGFPYPQLVQKFGVPMPGHPHQMRHLFKQSPADPAPPPRRDRLHSV